MKTPDEIKKGLECCDEQLNCDECPYHGETDCSYLPVKDGLSYIKSLELDIAERDELCEFLRDKAMQLEEELSKTKGRKKGLHSNVNDITGMRFGMLTVIEYVPHINRNAKSRNVQWLCKCDCGNETVVFGINLRKGLTKSCGCLRSRRFRTANGGEANEG